MSEERKEGVWAQASEPTYITEQVAGFRRAVANAQTKEDARRIVACVNACAGMPTEGLELIYKIHGGFQQLPAQTRAEALKEQRAHVRQCADDIISALVDADALGEAEQQRSEADAARRAANAEVLALTHQRDALLAALSQVLVIANDGEASETEGGLRDALERITIVAVRAIAAAGGAQ